MHKWAQKFVQAFKSTSPSKLKLHKLHSWIYHIIDSIRMYGAINGYTTTGQNNPNRLQIGCPILVRFWSDFDQIFRFEI